MLIPTDLPVYTPTLLDAHVPPAPVEPPPPSILISTVLVEALYIKVLPVPTKLS